MDWNAAIEKNREALKRVLAMLVAMAGLGSGRPATLPRHLHRAVLGLLRPAEAAVRRLIIVAARGIVVALPPPRPRKPRPTPTILRNGIGTGIVMPAGFPSPLRGGVRGGGPTAGRPSLALLDPLRPFRPRPKRPAASGFPRISIPGLTQPFPVPRAPSPDDPIDAARLALRLGALASALDDLPREARRFARWRVRRAAGRSRRVWPLRPGRPPGGRLARYDPDAPRRKNIRDVDEILAHAHALARYALSPDTS